jgi:DNA-binding SARP family transcriptional activator
MLLDEVADQAADPTYRLLAKLATTVLDIVTAGLDDPAGRLEEITIEAEFVGLPWVERLSRGLAEAVLGAVGPCAWRVTACVAVAAEAERAGDQWGAALLRLAAATAHRLSDPTADTEKFADAAARFRQLDAPVLAVWAESLQACVWAGDAHPAAAGFAQGVATAARSLRLPIAEALALRALTGGRAGNELRAAEVSWVRDVLTMLQPAGLRDIRVEKPADRSASDRVLIRCFGVFTVEINGVAVDLGPLRPRARTVLRILAVSSETDVHQESLVDALWPGTELGIGVRRLQVAISSARQLLERHGLTGSAWLPRHGNAYRLALGDGGQVDVREFEEQQRAAAIAASRGDTAGCVQAREAALAWYRGDLLPEDGPAEYVVSERERLRREAALTAAALATDLRHQGRMPEALTVARLSVRLERFQDAAWGLLAQLHEDVGDSSAAERTRREHLQVQIELESAVR